MKTNMKYMKHSFRATFYTIIPIILIFGWMTAHYSLDPIFPNQEFTTTVHFNEGATGNIELIVPSAMRIQGDAVKQISGTSVMWAVTGKQGEHELKYEFKGDPYTKKVLITNEQKYLDPTKKVNLRNSEISLITIDHNKKKILNVFGLRIGWLGTYIIFSILFSIGLRKLMKVY